MLDAIASDILTLDDGFLTFGKSPALQVTVDVDEFETNARMAIGTRDPAALQQAVLLYSGDLLPGDLYEDWAGPRRDGLRETHLQLLLTLAHVHEERRDFAGGIAALQKLLTADKSNEGAHTGLMRLYSLPGQNQQALRQYQVLREALRTELDAEPSPSTTQLYTAIQSGRFAPIERPIVAPLSVPGPSSQTSSNLPENKLPVQLTSFIGREAETSTVSQLLGRNRLVTLTGSGGTGKSRLALEVAERFHHLFSAGCHLIELAHISDPHAVPQTMATSLGLQRTQDITYEALLVSYLRDQEMLISLDNCEHLLEACAELAGGLLKNRPRLVLLTTSREALGIIGEVS